MMHGICFLSLCLCDINLGSLLHLRFCCTMGNLIALLQCPWVHLLRCVGCQISIEIGVKQGLNEILLAECNYSLNQLIHCGFRLFAAFLPALSNEDCLDLIPCCYTI